jgi:hypothetical protein
MRGLLVTPWFAAGAGFVIAAGLALNSPHTILTYKPNAVPCRTDCGAPAQSKGSTAVETPGVQIKQDRTARSGKSGHRPGRGGPKRVVVIGPEVGFKVLWHKYHEFGAVVSIPARQTTRGWSLRFDLPHTKITMVYGAQWRPSAGGTGGLAIRLTKQPGPGGSGGGHHGWPGPGHHHNRGPGEGSHGGWPGGGHSSNGPLGVSWWPTAGGFVVVADGSPVTPVGCELNGAPCHFG